MIKIDEDRLKWILHYVRLDDGSVTVEQVLHVLTHPYYHDTEEEHQEWMDTGDKVKIAGWVSMNLEIGEEYEWYIEQREALVKSCPPVRCQAGQLPDTG